MVFPDRDSLVDHPHEENSQNIDAIAKFIAALSRLTDTLPSGSIPERSSKSMEFFAQSKDYYKYPELVGDWLLSRDPASIHVIVTVENGDAVATTIEITNEQDAGVFYISRDTVPTDATAPDYIIDTSKPEEKQLTPLPRIPDTQLSAFLLSICRENLSAELAETTGSTMGLTGDMTDKLATNAFRTETDSSFELPSGRIIQVRTEAVAGRSRLASFTIYYETSSARRLRASIDTSTGVVVEFKTIDADTSQIIGDLHPEDGDYIRLTEILQEESDLLSSRVGGSVSVAPDEIRDVFDIADISDDA